MSGMRSSPPFPGGLCAGLCAGEIAGGIAGGFWTPSAVRGGKDIPVPELETPLKGEDPPPTFDGPLGKLKGGSEFEFSVIGNKSAAFGKGLRSIGPDEPGTLVLSGMLMAPPGLIIVGGGLAQGTLLDPEESRTSHLEFGSFDGNELVCSFGLRGENGPG